MARNKAPAPLPLFDFKAPRPVLTIRLPNGRSCRLSVYVASWKAIKALPDGAQVKGFGYFAEDKDFVLDKIRKGIADRINQKDPRYNKGRKWGWEWQIAARRVANNLNGQRIVTYRNDCPKELQARLAKRLYEYGDI